jgi:hypothetical protein
MHLTAMEGLGGCSQWIFMSVACRTLNGHFVKAYPAKTAEAFFYGHVIHCCQRVRFCGDSAAAIFIEYCAAAREHHPLSYSLGLCLHF